MGATDRLDEAVVDSRLWMPACQALQPPLPEAVPATFASAGEYAATFEPLLFEEAAEAVRAAAEESERSRRGVGVTLAAVHEEQNGWRRLELKPASEEAMSRLHGMQADRDTSVVVLTLPQPKQQQQQQQQQQQGGGGQPRQHQQLQAVRGQRQDSRTPTPPPSQQQQLLRVTGLVRRWELGGLGVLYVSVRPWCGRHAWKEGPCCQAYGVLSSTAGSGAVWQLNPAGSTVTAARELSTLARAQQIPILRYLLNPAAAAAAGEGGAGASGGAAPASSDAAQQAAAAAAGDDARSGSAAPPGLPPEVRSEAFWDHLQDRYDGPQLAAILGTAAHVMGGETAGQQQQLAAAAQGAAAAAAQPRRSSSSGGGSRSSSSSSPPVTLIQGPPGTGKTYTVLGVLNLWHMVLYHRHYASLDGVVQRLVDGWLPGERIDKVLLADDFTAHLAPRPRILVCAPSNAATDELLERVMRGGFRDKEARPYNPNVVRLGSEEALSAAAQEVWVEQLCGRILAQEPRAFHTELHGLAQQKAGLEVSIQNLAETIVAMRRLVNSSREAAAADPDDAARAGAAAQHAGQLQGVVTSLVRHFEALRVCRLELERRQIVQELVIGSRSRWWRGKLAGLFGPNNKGGRGAPADPGSQQQQQQQGGGTAPLVVAPEQWRAAFRAAPRELQTQLELSFVEHAEMVFTTLSSSAREVFSRLAASFPLVLIDEAAQAAEVASLQPLVYGARGVVMVGDPQQLPATIFSQAGKQLALERSLFERLDAGGCPVNVLRVQYRMHPAIRAFPSAYFYKGALIDADSVLERPEPWFRPTGAGGGGNGGGAGGSMQQQPPQLLVTAVGPAAGPSKRSRSPDPALAAAAAAAALAGGGGGGGGRRSSNDGGGGSSVPPDAAATLLLPYGVYDVAGGREHTVGRSKANSAEARLAVELYEALRPALLSREAQAAAEAAARNQGFLPLPPEVGIITPYRAQRDLIRDSLARRYSPAELARVKVETIDSFQGKQLDVVILSCVRAGGGVGGAAGGGGSRQRSSSEDGGGSSGLPGHQQQHQHHQQQQLPLNRRGVGFLSDVRRMNVAITRARLACLVLGHVDTLVQDAAWAALVGDARQRGCLFAVSPPGQQQAGGRLQQQVAAAAAQQAALVQRLQQQRQQQAAAGLGADGRPLKWRAAQQQQQPGQGPGPVVGPPPQQQLPAAMHHVQAQQVNAYEGMTPEQAAVAWVLWPLMAQQREASKLS